MLYLRWLVLEFIFWISSQVSVRHVVRDRKRELGVNTTADIAISFARWYAKLYCSGYFVLILLLNYVGSPNYRTWNVLHLGLSGPYVKWCFTISDKCSVLSTVVIFTLDRSICMINCIHPIFDRIHHDMHGCTPSPATDDTSFMHINITFVIHVQCRVHKRGCRKCGHAREGADQHAWSRFCEVNRWRMGWMACWGQQSFLFVMRKEARMYAIRGTI